MVASLHHPRYGEIPVVNNPVHLSATPGRVRRYPPGVGEHTDEVLLKSGVSADEIFKLRADRVIR